MALSEEVDADSAETPAKTTLEGDILSLKTGGRIIGQVVKRTPKEYMVEIAAGVTIGIPRRQVESIAYDDIDPRVGRRRTSEEDDNKHLIPGSEVSAALYGKLSCDVSTLSDNMDGKDLLAILKALGKHADVTIVVDAAVKELPPKEREWDFKPAPGTTLMTLLQRDLKNKLKKLVIIYQYDKILITTKEQAHALAKQNAPAASAPNSDAAEETDK